MSKAYICSVAKQFPENYEIGLRTGKWGVEEKYRRRIATVRPGDLIIFVVGGAFRSIHRVISEVYRETELVWSRKRGDLFPHRIDIGPAEVAGSVPVHELASRISFMRGKDAWWGTLQGPNGVFNARATPADVELITTHLMATTAPVPARSKSREREPQPRIVPVSPTYWLPDFLDRLASLARLHRVPGLTDPFRDAEVWQRGLLTGIYADTRDVPTVAVAPIDRSPQETVLSTLYGLSAAKQETAKAREVKGVIFVHEDQEEVSRLVHGVPNISTLEFDVHISLRRP